MTSVLRNLDPSPRPSRRITAADRGGRPRHRIVIGVAACLAALVSSGVAAAQDWGDDDDWSDSGSGATYVDASPATEWYLRAGLGFTLDPDEFLLNFELAHRFDQYVSLGPMFQVGLADNRSILAPTLNLTLTVPDMPGDAFDRFHPFLFAGVGLAVLENEDRGGRPDTRQTGFLVNTGFGVDYELDEQFSIGSRMIFNFLPGRTLNEDWFYSWEILGFKMAF